MAKKTQKLKKNFARSSSAQRTEGRLPVAKPQVNKLILLAGRLINPKTSCSRGFLHSSTGIAVSLVSSEEVAFSSSTLAEVQQEPTVADSSVVHHGELCNSCLRPAATKALYFQVHKYQNCYKISSDVWFSFYF